MRLLGILVGGQIFNGPLFIFALFRKSYNCSLLQLSMQFGIFVKNFFALVGFEHWMGWQYKQFGNNKRKKTLPRKIAYLCAPFAIFLLYWSPYKLPEWPELMSGQCIFCSITFIDRVGVLMWWFCNAIHINMVILTQIGTSIKNWTIWKQYSHTFEIRENKMKNYAREMSKPFTNAIVPWSVVYISNFHWVWHVPIIYGMNNLNAATSMPNWHWI